MGKGRHPYPGPMDSPGRGNLHNVKNDTLLKATGIPLGFIKFWFSKCIRFWQKKKKTTLKTDLMLPASPADVEHLAG